MAISRRHLAPEKGGQVLLIFASLIDLPLATCLVGKWKLGHLLCGRKRWHHLCSQGVCNFAEEMTSEKHFGEQDMPEYVVKVITALGNQKRKQIIMKKKPMKATINWLLCNPHSQLRAGNVILFYRWKNLMKCWDARVLEGTSCLRFWGFLLFFILLQS